MESIVIAGGVLLLLQFWLWLFLFRRVGKRIEQLENRLDEVVAKTRML